MRPQIEELEPRCALSVAMVGSQLQITSDNVVVTGAKYPTATSVLVNGASNVTIEGFNLVGASNPQSCGILVEGNGTNITISNCSVSGFGLGLSICTDLTHSIANVDWANDGVYSNVTVTNCTFNNNLVGGLDAHASWNILVNHCQAYGNAGSGEYESGFGIFFWQCTDVVCQNCQTWSNGTPGSTDETGGLIAIISDRVLFQYDQSWSNIRGQNDGDGIVLDSTPDSVMQFCYTHDNDGAGLWLGSEDGQEAHNDVMRFNVSVNDGADAPFGSLLVFNNLNDSWIYNNTVVTAVGDGAFWLYQLVGSGDVLANNLFISYGSVPSALTQSSLGGISLVNNDWWSYSGVPQSLPGYNVDPQLSNYQLGPLLPLARGGVVSPSPWDPASYATDNFMSQYFSETPTDYWGDGLPATGSWSVGAYQSPYVPIAGTTVYNPATGTWYPYNGVPFQFGFPGTVGLYINGQPAVYYPATGEWFIDHNIDTGDANPITFLFGFQGTQPVVFGNQVGVYFPATGEWYLDQNPAGQGNANPLTFLFGFPGTQAVTGNFFNDGLDHPAVYNPATGTWYLDHNTAAGDAAPVTVQFGFPGTQAVVWNDGQLGVYWAAIGGWLLDHNKVTGDGQPVEFSYGFPGTIASVNN